MCPSQYIVKTPTDISMFEIVGPWYNPRLSVCWPEFSIINKITDKTLAVPTEIPVSIFTAYRISKILKHTFDVYLFKYHGNIVTPLDS